MSLTPAGDILESATSQAYGDFPVVIPSMGEGAPYTSKTNEDLVITTTSIVQFSTYTLGPRIPTNAKIKKVQMVCKGIDSNATAAVAADINLIFSDAVIGGLNGGAAVEDGTSAVNANTIPTSALTGATTTIPLYASPNKMFGSAVVLVGNSGALKNQELTFLNSFTTAMKQLPIWDALGFTSDPGGFFQFFVVIETAPSTAAAGSIQLEVSYAL